MRGIGLIDLVIGLMLTGVLVAVALPLYTEPLAMARRRAAVVVLWDAQRLLQDHRDTAGSYAGATLGPAQGQSPSQGIPQYRISLAVAGDGRGYVLYASPEGVAADDRCGTLWLDHTGNHGQDPDAGRPACWP